MGISPRHVQVFAVVVVAGAMALVGCSSGSPRPTTPGAAPSSTAPAPPSYRNEQSGFALTPPRGWQQVPGFPAAAVTFAAPAGSGVTTDTGGRTLANLNVVVTPTDADLDANLAGAKQLLPTTFPNYQPSVDEPFTLADGQPGHLLGCTYTLSGLTLRNLQLVAVARGNVYVVSATAPDQTFATYEPAIRQSLATFGLI